MMNNYITGKITKELREKEHLTQMELANIIGVSDKTISKWETGKGIIYVYCNKDGLMKKYILY